MREVRGQSGQVVAGYQLAASLGAWLLVPAGAHRYTVSAAATHTSEHWLNYRPLRLVLDIGWSQWSWDSVELRWQGDRVTAVVTGRPRVDRVA